MNKKISLDIKKKRGYNTRIEGKGAVHSTFAFFFLFFTKTEQEEYT